MKFSLRDLLLVTVIVALTTGDRGGTLRSADDSTKNTPPLTNDMLEWKGTAIGHAGPIVVGKPAQAVLQRGIDRTEELIALLDKPESFIVAHVLLTKMWKVRDQDKECHSFPISTGYLIAYNGLKVRIDWKDEAGKVVKTVTVSDTERQMKRIREWWKKRYHENPTEFSSQTEKEYVQQQQALDALRTELAKEAREKYGVP